VDAPGPATLTRLVSQPPRRRHVVLVLVGRPDRSLIGAIRYARALRPATARGLHVALDPEYAERLVTVWDRVGLSPFPLEIRQAPDRRLVRTVLMTAAEELDGRTHVSLVLPRRIWRPSLAVVAHDRIAAALVQGVTHAHVEHLTVTVVPFVVRDRRTERAQARGEALVGHRSLATEAT